MPWLVFLRGGGTAAGSAGGGGRGQAAALHASKNPCPPLPAWPQGWGRNAPSQARAPTRTPSYCHTLARPPPLRRQGKRARSSLQSTADAGLSYQGHCLIERRLRGTVTVTRSFRLHCGGGRSPPGLPSSWWPPTLLLSRQPPSLPGSAFVRLDAGSHALVSGPTRAARRYLSDDNLTTSREQSAQTK